MVSGRHAFSGLCGRWLLWTMLLLPSACSHGFFRQVDSGHQAMERGMVDVVNRVDRIFGEPRVEDRERKVKIVAGPRLVFKEAGVTEVRGRVSGRIPLPSLERRTNIFLEVGGRVDSQVESGVLNTQEREEQLVTRVEVLKRSELPVDLGLGAGVRWRSGPQGVVRPFIRWEHRSDQLRYYLSQEVIYRTDEGFAETTYVHLDQILDQVSFLRYFSDATVENEVAGVTMGHGTMYRRPWAENGAISYEVGVEYNTAHTERGRTYLQVHLVQKVLRPWLEFEIRPRVAYPWQGGGGSYSLFVGANVIFERYLEPTGGGARPPDPGVAGGPARGAPGAPDGGPP
jgi:hypothetical protein